MYRSIMAWDAEMHPIKHQDFDTQEAADSYISENAGVLPGTFADAFSVQSYQVPDIYVTVDPLAKTAALDTGRMDEDAIKTEAQIEIKRLEGEITPRRMREALLNTEFPEGWIASQEVLIATERAKLRKN